MKPIEVITKINGTLVNGFIIAFVSDGTGVRGIFVNENNGDVSAIDMDACQVQLDYYSLRKLTKQCE